MVRALPYTRAAVSSVRGTDWPNAGLVLMLSFRRRARLLPSVAPLLVVVVEVVVVVVVVVLVVGRSRS